MPDIFTSPPPQIKPETIPAVDPVPQKDHRPREKVSLFSTFCRFPQDIRFQNQEEGEDVHLVIRRHFITNAPWIASGLALSLAPLLFFLFSPFFENDAFSLAPKTILFLLLFY